MCGLGGILHFDAQPVPVATLTAMGDALRHRGPDAQGTYLDSQGSPAVGLVHRRLSIIDLREVADQPLPNEDGSVQALLNGEIYNFRELRQRLEGSHTFRSQGDTEVIVHLYEEEGDAAVAALDGMFTLVLWDARKRRLLLARDGFGKKPLYYWHDAHRFVFGSEIKALLAAGVEPQMEQEHLGEYLAFGYVPTPETLFRGFRKLPPACTLVVDDQGVHAPHQYWNLSFPRDGEAAPVHMEEAAERVLELLTAGVSRRLVADVPLGVLLSGGVDSSAIAALMTRLSSSRVKSFTVGFEGDAFYDERPHARRVAEHLGTDHHESFLRPQAAELIETLLHHHDEPFGDSSALPTYLVAQQARQHVTVVLNGDGGDETFAGYDRFHAAQLSEALPGPLRNALLLCSHVLPQGATYHGLLRRMHRFASQAALPLEERIFAWSAFFDLPALHALDGNGLADRGRILSSYHQALGVYPHASLLSRLLYLNARTYLLDDLLPKMDRMTMAHGLEARSPLLDRALVEYVATLPDGLKRQGSRGKLVLKRAAAKLLPREILERPKHGFGVPLGEWFRGQLQPMVQDTLLSGSRLARRLRPGAIAALYQEHCSRRADRGQQLWTLLTLELWLRKHRFD